MTTFKPSRKVTVGTVSGAVVVILVWGASMFGVDVPAQVAAAATVLVTAGVAYLVPNAELPPTPSRR